MIKLFHVLSDKLKLKREPKEGKIEKEFDTGYDELLAIYEEWKEKSIRENVYYLTGSSYFKSLIDQKYPPEIIRSVVLNRCLAIDKLTPPIPLEVGEMLEEMNQDPNTVIGMHRSYAVQSDPFEDDTLHEIMRDGLINNGAAMQGMVSLSPPYPAQTISSATDMMNACFLLKTSFRGSKGAVLLRFPKDVVTFSMDFQREADPFAIYEKRGNIYYIKPEFIVGYIDTRDGKCQYHTREELLVQYKEKEVG